MKHNDIMIIKLADGQFIIGQCLTPPPHLVDSVVRLNEPYELGQRVGPDGNAYMGLYKWFPTISSDDEGFAVTVNFKYVVASSLVDQIIGDAYLKLRAMHIKQSIRILAEHNNADSTADNEIDPQSQTSTDRNKLH